MSARNQNNSIVRTANGCTDRSGADAMDTVSASRSTEIRRQGMQLLADGMTTTLVAERLGVSARTVRRWRDRDSADRSERKTYRGRRRLTAAECDTLHHCILTTGPYNYAIHRRRL